MPCFEVREIVLEPRELKNLGRVKITINLPASCLYHSKDLWSFCLLSKSNSVKTCAILVFAPESQSDRPSATSSSVEAYAINQLHHSRTYEIPVMMRRLPGDWYPVHRKLRIEHDEMSSQLLYSEQFNHECVVCSLLVIRLLNEGSVRYRVAAPGVQRMRTSLFDAKKVKDSYDHPPECRGDYAVIGLEVDEMLGTW
ncbi:hypothetical protein C8R48DRAFT_671506 [Suillus tomentosus]|nr:hypothetical protein C8R48DRAFT_671506 [Suillus tomentosus]